jgi:phenylalanyl-tRNA synthetase beta chain
VALDRLRERVIALGYQEIVAIPLVDARRDELFRPEGIAPAVIGNPLAEDASVMRSTGIVSMLSALEWNLNHGQRNLRLFESGRAYELRNGEPVETPVLTIGATGLAREKSIYEEARELSFADLKGDLDRIGELAGGFHWQAGADSWLLGARSAQVFLGKSGNEAAGVAGQLARRVADQLKLRQDIFIAELRLGPLLKSIEGARAALRFTAIPRFPAVERDFAFVLSDGITFAQVAEVIWALGFPELQQIEAADLFRGGQIAAGKFSLMIRVTFQSAQTTLTDAQIAEFSSRIVGALEGKLGATLRAA